MTLTVLETQTCTMTNMRFLLLIGNIRFRKYYSYTYISVHFFDIKEFEFIIEIIDNLPIICQIIYVY